MPYFALLQSQAGPFTTNLYAKYRDKAIGWKFLREVKVKKGLSWISFEYIKGDGAIEREFLNSLRASEYTDGAEDDFDYAYNEKRKTNHYAL